MAKGKKKDGSIECTMVLEKETKRTVRYNDEVEDSSKNIYLKQEELKEAFGGYPEKITVTIESAD